MTDARKASLVRGLVVAAIAVVVVLGWLHRSRGTVASGSHAPDFAFPSLKGDTVSLRSLRGKVVLVNAWATWCRPCRDEMPALQRLYEALGPKGLVVLAVSQDELPTIGGPLTGSVLGPVREYVAAMGLTFPVLLDPAGRLADAYGFPGLPTSYVIDKAGRVARMEIGARPWDEAPFRTQIERLLED
jgi:peroxiredoxin